MSLSAAAVGKLLAVATAGAATASTAAAVLPVEPSLWSITILGIPLGVPVEPSLWSITILGIPLGVLAASLSGSSARALRDPSQDDRKLPRRALNTLIDGFIGGWVAMFVYTFSYSKDYFTGVEPAILGAFGGLLTEYIRTNAPRWTEQAWGAALSMFSRNKRPGEDAPQ